jgi:xanthine dehydrogenase iron-sulfur cluster and FAD-binding subunit A
VASLPAFQVSPSYPSGEVNVAKQTVELLVNGDRYEVAIDPWRTLAEVLREDLGLIGTKIGCNQGDCGACTVLIDGRSVSSCLTFAVEADQHEITTIEGVAHSASKLHPIQEAFVDKGAVQCGFCTAGMILAAKYFLANNPSPSEAEIRQGLSGNLCRCTGYNDSVRVIAGGTDLTRKLRDGEVSVDHLVSLNRVRDLDRIGYRSADGLFIGACARLSDVAAHAEVRRRYPALQRACSLMATTQIRNMGTVAGNIANGSPCADTAGPLLIYEAVAILAERSGGRRVPVVELVVGPGEVDIEPAEIVETIRMPPPPQRAGSSYMRLSARSRVDMAAVSVAGLVALHPDGRVSDARLALGAVAPTPLRCGDAEKLLLDQMPSSSSLERAAAECARAAQPIDDVRATAEYRRAMVEVLARRVLVECVAAARRSER